MKRPKVDLSSNGMKEFFFCHGEKVFFGLACVLIVLFFWMGFKTEKYTRTTPVDMSSTADRARDYIARSDSWDKIKEYRQADSEAVAKIENDQGLDMEKYVFSSRLSGAAVKTLALRTDPQMLAPKDLHVQFFRAQLALRQNSPGVRELRRGVDHLENSELTLPPMYRYEKFVYRPQGAGAGGFEVSNAVVGMAIMPHKVQQTAYNNIFQFARNYDSVRDIPRYLFLEVERKDSDSDQWESITEHIHSACGQPDSPTASPAMSISDPDYLVEGIAMKIPPFLGIDYRPFAQHPDVPMKDVITEDEALEEESTEDSSNSGGSVFGDQGSGGDKVEQDATDDELKKNDPPVRLVRFYDLEPKEIGKTYQYRIRVWVADPNDPKSVDAVKTASAGFTAGLGRGGGAGGGFAADDDSSGGGGSSDSAAGGNVLPEKDPEPLNWNDLAAGVRNRINRDRTDLPSFDSQAFQTEVEKFLQHAVPTPWSDPSNPVTITSGFETFVTGPVDQPPINEAGGGQFQQDEPSAFVVINSFQDDLGVSVPAETEAYRGTVLNFNAATYVLHPIQWTIKEVHEGVDNRGDKIGRRFETDAIVIDMMGGERQPGISKGREDQLNAPGDVLIMDRQGNFIVRNDLEDQMEYRHAMFVSDNNERIKEEANRRGGSDDDEEEGDGRGR